MHLPNIDLVSAKVHEAWMQKKAEAGVTSRKLESGEELMVPYAQLSEQAKDLDRGSVAVVYAAIAECSMPFDEPVPDVLYRGLTLRWTGWKTQPSTIDVCGQWFAKDPLRGRMGAYASYPGGEGIVHHGSEIDCTIRAGQNMTDSFFAFALRPASESRAILAAARQDALDRLKVVIDRYLDEPAPEVTA